MADDNVLIQPSSTTPGPPVAIKTFSTKDPSVLSGLAVVEIQAVVITDELGRPLPILTALQGDEIIRLLKQINNSLAVSTGVGNEEAL